MIVWAHRGFSSRYPENTMVAFEAARDAGADGIETDVHLTKDGEVVVIHDENLLRTTGVDKKVCDCTLSEITKIKASKTMDDKFDAYVPSFEEFCAFIKESGMKANVELKTGVIYYPGIEEKVASLIKKYGIEDSADQYYIDHTTPLTLESRYNDREYVRAVAGYMAEAYEYILAKGVIIKDVEPMHQTDYTEGGSSPETVGRWTYCDQDAEDWVSYADGIAP